MPESNSASDFRSLDDIPCHVLWSPFRGETEASYQRLICSLQGRKTTEPRMRALHWLSLAYLHWLKSDEGQCRKHLEEAKQPTREPLAIDVSFLVKALELHAMHKFDSNQQREEALLSELSALWQQPQTRASVYGAKGWTLLSFGKKTLHESIKAFREALKLEAEHQLSPSFHWRYGLALAMAKQRRQDNLSGEVGEERVELWDEAKKILDNAGVKDAVFLARFAEAIAYSPGHFDKCEKLADEAVWPVSENLQACTICAKVYRGLTKLLQWQRVPDQNGITVERLKTKELSVLQTGQRLYETSNNDFLQGDFAFQLALYYIKTQEAGEDRIQKARAWLAKANRDDVWAQLRLLNLDEDEATLVDNEIRQRYEKLILQAEKKASPASSLQVKFELGRFLFVKGIDRSQAIGLMQEAKSGLPSLYFVSRTKRQAIVHAASHPGIEKDHRQWIEDNIPSGDLAEKTRFPASMVNAGYRWRLGCSDCCESRVGMSFEITKSAVDHGCSEEWLLLAQPNSSCWCRIRPFDQSNTARQIQMCELRTTAAAEAAGCSESCRKAHSDAELRLWELEQRGDFSQLGFLRQVSGKKRAKKSAKQMEKFSKLVGELLP